MDPESVASASTKQDWLVNRRRRPYKTGTCLECKRRRSKCDKLAPCGTCRGRGEADRCSYADGIYPAPAPAASGSSFIRSQGHQLPARQDVSQRTPITKGESAIFDMSNPSTASMLIGVKDTNSITTPSMGYHLPQGTPVSQTTSPDDPGNSNGGSQRMTEWPNILSTTGPPYSRDLKRWERDLDEIIQALPDTHVINFLVDHMYSPDKPLWHDMMEYPLRLEIAQFHELRLRGRSRETDPAWLALLAIILAFSCGDLIDRPQSAMPLPLEEMKILVADLMEAYETALRCSNWMSNPQMRVLNALIVYFASSYVATTESYTTRGRQPSLILTVDIAAAICRTLGLHQLGPSQAPNTRLPKDPMLPPDKPIIARFIACSTFNSFFFFDSFTFRKRSGFEDIEMLYSFPEGSYNTEEAQNYRHEDILNSPNPQPRPIYEESESVLEVHRYRLSKHWRHIQESQPETMPYDLLLELDRRLRMAYQDFMNLGMYTSHGSLKRCGIQVYNQLNSSYGQRFLRLHRSYLLQSYEDDRYLASQNAAVSAARTIMLSHKILIKDGYRNPWYLFLHHLSAATVIFIHSLNTPSELYQGRQELRESHEIFADVHQESGSSLARAAASGSLILEAMLKVLDSPFSGKRVEAILADLVKAASNSDSAVNVCINLSGPSREGYGHINVNGNGMGIWDQKSFSAISTACDIDESSISNSKRSQLGSTTGRDQYLTPSSYDLARILTNDRVAEGTAGGTGGCFGMGTGTGMGKGTMSGDEPGLRTGMITPGAVQQQWQAILKSFAGPENAVWGMMEL